MVGPNQELEMQLVEQKRCLAEMKSKAWDIDIRKRTIEVQLETLRMDHRDRHPLSLPRSLPLSLPPSPPPLTCVDMR